MLPIPCCDIISFKLFFFSEIKVCQPNPCLHAGICSVVSKDQYKCDCTNTGYTGTKCDIGHFNISDYPTVVTNVVSPPISVRCSPPTDYVILRVSSRDVEFVPPSLVFSQDTPLVQSIRVTARETGYHFVTYSISGPSAREFILPEENVLFVKSHENSTEKPPIEESTLYFPIGCHKKQVGLCPGENVIPVVVSSTSPFVSFGPLTSSEGVVALEIGNITRIPLSLRGLNLPHPSEESFPDFCNEDDVVSYSIESLIKSRYLVKSFTNIVTDSLPTWMNITPSENNMAKKTYSSDLMTHFLTGIQLHEAAVGQGLPVISAMFYSLLATKSINVTIEDDIDILNSNSLSLAVELCRESPPNIILQQSTGVIKDIKVLKNLREYGWKLNLDSIQFSKTGTIERPKMEFFWNGEHFVNLRASSGGNFATVLSLKKHFQNSTFADVRMEFDGTLIVDVKDINQVLY